MKRWANRYVKGSPDGFRQFAKKRRTLKSAWENCHDAEFLLWILMRSQLDAKMLALCLLDMLTSELDRPTDTDPGWECIDTIGRWSRGEATDHELCDMTDQSLTYSGRVMGDLSRIAWVASHIGEATYPHSHHGWRYKCATWVAEESADFGADVEGIIRRHFPDTPRRRRKP